MAVVYKLTVKCYSDGIEWNVRGSWILLFYELLVIVNNLLLPVFVILDLTIGNKY